MRFETLEVVDFGSYAGTHKLHLADRGLVLVVGENLDDRRMSSNGSGKSMLFDALDWALFGVSPRGDHAEAVVNVRADKCCVRVQIREDDGRLLTIERTQGSEKGLSVWVDGEALATLDARQTQALLEQRLGLDRDTFHAAVLFGQVDRAHFVDQSDAGRMESLTRILQLESIDSMESARKEMAEKNAQSAAEQERTLANLQGQLTGINLPLLEERVQWHEEERRQNLDRLNAAIEAKRLEARSNEKRPTVEHLQAALQEVERGIQVLAPPSSQAMEEARLKVAEIRVEMSARQRDEAKLAAEIAVLQRSTTGVCSLCGQMISQAHLQREVEVRMQRAQKLRQDLQQFQTVLDGWEARAAREAEAYRVLSQAHSQAKRQEESRRLVFVQEIEAAKALQLVKQHVAGEIARYQAEADAVARAPNPHVADMQRASEDYATLKAQIEALDREIGQRGLIAKHLDFWGKALGPKGLKSFILDLRAQELTDTVNAWLRPLSGGSLWIQFASQKQTRTAGVKNAPTLRVFRMGKDGVPVERNYRSWSGGERQRISFAVDFGLSRLIARRARYSYDVLILDEVFRHLDSAGKEAVVEMLHHVAREKSSVFVVEHDREFQGSFERMLLVRKSGECSAIVEDTHGIAKNKVEGESRVLPGDAVSSGKARRNPVRRPVRKPVGPG